MAEGTPGHERRGFRRGTDSRELTEADWVATIDYRVFGKGEELSFHHLFEDCKDALRFLAKIPAASVSIPTSL